MSKLFGPVVQQENIVPDIDEAMQHWIARGVGPFYIEKRISSPFEINGKKAEMDIFAALPIPAINRLKSPYSTTTCYGSTKVPRQAPKRRPPVSGGVVRQY